MAKIRMRTTSAGPAGVRRDGDVVEVREEEARALIEAGYADAVAEASPPASSPPSGEGEDAAGDQEESADFDAGGEDGGEDGEDGEDAEGAEFTDAGRETATLEAPEDEAAPPARRRRR